MNYKYRMIGVSHVINEAEHQFVQNEFKNGKTVVSIRGGKIGINISAVSWNPTDELTDEEMVHRGRTPLLDTPRTNSATESIAKGSCKFRTHMGWAHPKYCYCKKGK